MPLDLSALLDSPLPAGTKGLPYHAAGLPTAALGEQGWNLLAGDLPFPAAVLKSSALANNIRAMHDYVSACGLQLAPHGKTTMCPQLFERQLDAGAWGITVATIAQAELCHAVGVPRILIANELIGETEVASFAAMCADAPDRDHYVLVDSLAGARQLAAAFAKICPDRPARVLIEVGMIGGRCGVRTLDEGLELAKAINAMRSLRLAGIEGYEGLIGGADRRASAVAVEDYLDLVDRLFGAVHDAGLFPVDEPIVLSAGGSVYYDLVARQFIGRSGGAITPVLRSGCYVTQDSVFYRDAQDAVIDRAINGSPPPLGAAMEIWARVLSTPEPGRVILGAGKRDLSHDIDLPVPLHWFRPGKHREPQPIGGWRIAQLSDQHAFALRDSEMPEPTPLEVGDLVAVGISHPCTTFDKWSLLYEVDDDYSVLRGLRTCF